ncbi:subtilisin-like protein [Colletotrichum sublineola]|nr:subtilisin-like protein [Colletotrichum sublineola]
MLKGSPDDYQTHGFETGVLLRKAVIYDLTVQPLEKLLRDFNYWENLRVVDPVQEVHEQSQPPTIPKALAPPEKNSEADNSNKRLEKIQRINEAFREGARRSSVQAPRVAILDTGYDGNSSFFNHPERRRKIKWKDFVESSQEPVDEAGHGTHTTALAMTVAPFASIYSVRIAKNRGDLKQASQAIANAIDWAANDINADIISMSFGFQQNVPIIAAAIRKAIHERNGTLIFFAAASNSGGNSREMFPANLADVFSVRETNGLGAFSDTNPPVDLDGPVVFGTLGKEVPSAWLSSHDGNVAKSGSSVATAVAAGIAALLMTIADVGVADSNLKAADALKLRTKPGMLEVLKEMSQPMGNRCRYIPPKIFELDVRKTWETIAYACGRSN